MNQILWAKMAMTVIPRWLWSAVGAVVLVWLFLSGVLIFARGAALAALPFGTAQALLAGVMLPACAWLSRSIVSTGQGRYSRLQSVLALVVSSAALFFWGLSLGRGAGLAAGVMWAMFLAEETWAWFRHAAFHRPIFPNFGRREHNSEDRLIQQLTRTITPEGGDVIRGRLSVCIDRGSRMAAGHVAFCPPFIERPSFEIEPADATVATLKISQLYSHGARVEVRLPQLAQAETPVCIRFVARARLAEAVPD